MSIAASTSLASSTNRHIIMRLLMAPSSYCRHPWEPLTVSQHQAILWRLTLREAGSPGRQPSPESGIALQPRTCRAPEHSLSALRLPRATPRGAGSPEAPAPRSTRPPGQQQLALEGDLDLRCARGGGLRDSSSESPGPGKEGVFEQQVLIGAN